MNKFKNTVIVIVLALVSVLANATPKAPYIWVRLLSGLNYTTHSFAIGVGERATIHAFMVDPQKYKLDVLMAMNEKEGATIQELAEFTGALVAVNGGFFTPQHSSIGLVVKAGHTMKKLHKTSWWSVFAVSNGVPAIYSPNEFTRAKMVETAIQAGPRLAVNGATPKLKEGLAQRSAVGITKDGKVIIAMTSGMGISLNELAKKMSASRLEGGLECPNAMALDGGSSSQLYAKVGSFELNLQGLARITNGLAIMKKLGSNTEEDLSLRMRE